MMMPWRIDDLGASSKLHERHRGKWWPYRELRAEELATLMAWLARTGSRVTLAITARWVTRRANQIPYARMFPEQAAVIRLAVQHGLVEVACHGLTHCIPGRHADWTFWRSNRQWHREFIDALPFPEQVEHLRVARAELEQTFLAPVTTLVPPGNAISERLALTALDLGFTVVTCRRPDPSTASVIADDRAYPVTHDRDLVAWGMNATLATNDWCSLTTRTVREWATARVEVVP